MKDIAALLIIMMSMVGALGIGGFLIYKKSDGWGWYLFVVLVLFGSLKATIDDKPIKQPVFATEEGKNDHGK